MEKQPMDYDKKQESVKNIIAQSGVSDIAALLYIDMAMHSHEGKFLASIRTLSQRHKRPQDAIAESMTALANKNLIEYRLTPGKKRGDSEYYVIFKN
jgi:hypothetical protein